MEMSNNTGTNVSRNHPSAAATTPRNAAVHYPLLHHHHPVPIPFSPLPYKNDSADDFPRRDERFPQWGNQEIRDFIQIRAQFESEPTAPKTNRGALWEMVSNGMREKGYKRTPDQCRCKWDNLVTRYKGQETVDVDNSRQCPFFDELHAVFTSRATNPMQQPVIPKAWKMPPNASEDPSRKEFLHETDGEEEETKIEQATKTRVHSKIEPGRGKRQKVVKTENKDENSPGSLQEMMRSYMAQQQRIDVHWRELVEKHAEEREILEDEWRERMEKLERERVVMEMAWREKEEQRRLREESRAEKRDALLTLLVNKLVQEENREIG